MRQDGGVARPPRFTPDGILDAAGDVAVQRWRDATVADVAERLSTPPGSVYYRFPTRDALFGSLWLRAVTRFQEGFLAATRLDDPDEAATAAALQLPQFCRDHPVDAVAMTLYRQPDLATLVEGDLREQVGNVNDAALAALADLARRRYGSPNERHFDLIRLACQESPYGMVRRHLRTPHPIPVWIDDVVRATTPAILATGDA